MGIYYTLKNMDVESATAVAIRNLMLKPSQEAGGDATPGPTFAYTAWQFLRPSPQASELFCHEEKLYAGVRHSGQPWSNAEAQRHPVHLGRSYLLVAAGDKFRLQQQPQNKGGDSCVEILVPVAAADPLSVEIDWYLGGSDPLQARRVGITRDVHSGGAAHYQPDHGVLLFFTVPSGDGGQRIYDPSDLQRAQPYKAPANATAIIVTLQAGDGGAPQYIFDQRSTLVSG